MKTGYELVVFALSTVGHPYMYGVNGQKITLALIEAKRKQYPTQYTDSKINILKTRLGETAYQCNSYLSLYLGVQRSANGWRSYGTGGMISSIPEQAGVSVHYNRHTGIYLGRGYVVEARGTAYGVVITRLNDRPWTTWRKMPGIQYDDRVVDLMILTTGMKDRTAGGYAGTAVREWQTVLMLFGISMVNNGKTYGIDGEFGTATANGTREFQKQEQLPITGTVDLFTFIAMLNRLRKREPVDNHLQAEYTQVKNALKALLEVAKNADT